jgi:hypothetical protein
MTGDEDEPSIEVSVMIKRTRAEAALAVLPKSGHGINLEEPALFNQLLDDFLHQVERAAPRERLSRSRNDLSREARGRLDRLQPAAKRNAINGECGAASRRRCGIRRRCRSALRRVSRRGQRAFSAGADISEFEKIRAERQSVSQYDGLLDEVLHAIQDSRKPSLAMIHGFCMGGGAGDRARLRPALLRRVGAVRHSGGEARPRLQRRGPQAPARDRRPRARARSCSSAAL